MLTKRSKLIKEIPKSSRLFLIAGMVIIIFSIVIKLFLLDRNFADNFKSLTSDFHNSYLFFLIGIVYFIFAAFSFLTNVKLKISISEKLAFIHFISTTIVVFGLMGVAIIDTICGDVAIHEKYPILNNVVMVFAVVGIFMVLLSAVTLIINIFLLVGKAFKVYILRS